MPLVFLLVLGEMTPPNYYKSLFPYNIPYTTSKNEWKGITEYIVI